MTSWFQIAALIDTNGCGSRRIRKSGAWYTYEGEQLGQGRENAKQFLAENPEIMVEVSEKIRQAVGLVEADEDEMTEADEEPISLDD